MSIVRPMRAAAGFLTRVRLSPEDVTEEELGHSLAYFPVVGLALGGVLAGSAHILEHLIPASVVAVTLVGLHVLMTGALHLDGVADVADGLGAGDKDTDRMLDAMRDSQIGSFGTVALIVLLLGKTLVLFELLQLNQFLTILVFPVIARAIVVPMITWFPYAREEGLGLAFKNSAGMREVIIAASVAGVAIVLTDWSFLLAALVAAGVSIGFASWIQKKLDGLTGDVYGAVIEGSELVFLVAVLAGT